MTEPEESAVREAIRSEADAILLDAAITFVATMRHKGLSGDTYGPLIIDEWSAALMSLATQSRESLEDYRVGGVIGALHPSSARDEFDSSIEQMIEERRAQLGDGGQDREEV